jgi:tetratricopeptide (TPR) repeat protein
VSDPARARFREACAHDRAGREAESIPCYEEALALGLGEPQRPMALLGLGSSLRNVRRHREAVEVLAGAAADYPDHAGLRFFLALALRSAGRERDAFRTLGRIVLDEADLRGYDRAAAFYLEHLD